MLLSSYKIIPLHHLPPQASRKAKPDLNSFFYPHHRARYDMLIDFLERGEGRKRERERNMDGLESSHMCPNQGTNLQPRQVP